MTHCVHSTQRFARILTEAFNSVKADGESALDASNTVSDNLFHQTRRLLDLDPNALHSAVSPSHQSDLHLFSYPTLVIIDIPPLDSFQGVPSSRQAVLKNAYFQACWLANKNSQMLGCNKVEQLLGSWDLKCNPLDSLSEEDLRLLRTQCSRSQLPRSFVRHYYDSGARMYFSIWGVSQNFISLVAKIADVYGIGGFNIDVTQVVKKIFEDQSEESWWWRISFCRLELLLTIDVQPLEDHTPLLSTLWHILYDENVLVAIDALQRALSEQQGLRLFDSSLFKETEPDPANKVDCIHGTRQVPSEYTIPTMPFVCDLFMSQPTGYRNTPLFALCEKVRFFPSQSRMIASVINKRTAKHDYVWPQLASIVLAGLLGNYTGVQPMRDLAIRASLANFWHRMEWDRARVGVEWKLMITLVGIVPTFFTTYLRLALLHSIISLPALELTLRKELDIGSLWSVVRQAQEFSQTLWCTGPVQPFSVIESCITLVKGLRYFETTILANFRQPLLNLFVRKRPVPLFSAIAKTRKSICPVELKEKCAKCTCHVQSSMQCFLDPDSVFIPLLKRCFKLMPAGLEYPEIIMFALAVRAGVSQEELEDLLTLVFNYYTPASKRGTGQGKNGLDKSLKAFRDKHQQVYAFMATFALMHNRKQEFAVFSCKDIDPSTLSPVDTRVRVVYCEWCKRLANESLFGGYGKIRTDLFCDLFADEPVYRCKTTKTATKPCQCGCQITRENKICGQPMTSVYLNRHEVLQTSTQLYLRCANDECSRIFGMAVQLDPYDPFLRGYLCPLCGIYRREQVRRLLVPALWRILFDVYSNQKKTARRGHKTTQKEDDADENEDDVTEKNKLCDICTFGERKYNSRAKPKSEKEMIAAWRKKKTKKTKDRFSYKLPGWSFELCLCKMHKEESLFLTSLENHNLTVKLNPGCREHCICDDGRTTCDGCLNLGTVITLWNRAQDLVRGEDMIAQMHKCMGAVSKHRHPDRGSSQ